MFIYLQLGVSPTGDFDDHVQDSLFLVSEKRNIVERRDGDTILFYMSLIFLLCSSVFVCIIPSLRAISKKRDISPVSFF